MESGVYLCIDLKSFYASVECVERGLDPMSTNLVVADPERGNGTICLAVSPSMKKLGVKNRCRVYEIPSNIDYIMAVPRMKLYINYSAEIYGIYLKYIAKEDIHVYSIDEAFLDIKDYLKLYKMGSEELAVKIMDDIKATLGITAATGIGTNLYLAKVALDIMAKKSIINIGYLDEKMYCEKLWNHKPLTDFWRVGKGISDRLGKYGITTMGEIAKADEDYIYDLFGIDAELLIDHAWGRESVTMSDIKAYRPKSNSLSNSQVLPRDYKYDEGCLIVKEMTDSLCLDLVERGLTAKSVTLIIRYSFASGGESVRGTVMMLDYTNSYQIILSYILDLYYRITDKEMSIRKITICFNKVTDEAFGQYNLFAEPEEIERERKLQNAVLEIKRKYGNNALLKGMNLQSAGTAAERNLQIGGHKSGE